MTTYKQPLSQAIQEMAQTYFKKISQIPKEGEILWLGEFIGGHLSEHLVHLTDTANQVAKESLPTIISNYYDLPVASDAMAMVIGSHLLNQTNQPELILQELWRILLPEGHLVLLGYNSNSFLRLPHAIKKGVPTTPMMPIFALRRQLLDLGFEIVDLKTFFFRPALNQRGLLKMLVFLDWMGKICCPFQGGLFLLVAKKPVLGVTPLRVQWEKRKVTIPAGIVEPTARRN